MSNNSGLDNAISAANGRPFVVTLGDSYSTGYWSGSRFMITRARMDYDCQCGAPEHQIKKGDLYMSILPDRLASWGGDRYRHRMNLKYHANWHLVVYSKKGEKLGEFWPPEQQVEKEDE